MDARELTQYVYKLNDRIRELEKKVDYLEQEYAKQRLKMEYMAIDVKMLQSRR